MTIWVCLNVYQEESLLPECLESVRSCMPEAKIVAVDGAYQSFINEVKKLQAHHIEYNESAVASQLDKYTFPFSTDRTVEILNQYKVEKIVQPQLDEAGKPMAWLNEVTKRSQYLIGDDGDWYFVLDADERIQGKISWAELVDEAYNVMLERDDNVGAYPILRVFRHSPGIRYYGAHHAIWIKEILYTKKMCRTLPNVKLFHRQLHRHTKDPIRLMAKGAYYRYLTSKEEAGFRAQYGL